MAPWHGTDEHKTSHVLTLPYPTQKVHEHSATFFRYIFDAYGKIHRILQGNASKIAKLVHNSSN